jgi:hypothetical protein
MLRKHSHIIEPTESLRLLLDRVRLEAESDFEGLSIVVYDGLEGFRRLCPAPIPMTPDSILLTGIDEMHRTLLASSRASSEKHDGFHFVDLKSWSLTHLAMYFPPPAVAGYSVFPGSRPGTRCFAGMFASLVPGVICSGFVRASDRSLYVFKSGKLILEG